MTAASTRADAPPIRHRRSPYAYFLGGREASAPAWPHRPNDARGFNFRHNRHNFSALHAVLLELKVTKILKEGSKAPAFSLPTDDGSVLSLKDCAGKTLVLYFYPKDDTPGCTREAVDFSGLAQAFSKAGAVVVGVSKDSLRKHEKFKEKHALKVSLGSDESGRIIEAYGAWVEKTLYGRTYMGVDRSTFLIDGKGVIRGIWRRVKVAGHAEEVLAAAQSL